MMALIKALVKSVVTDRRLVLGWLLLLGLHLVGFLFLYDVAPEFDMVPHFLFGVMLSESASMGAHSTGLHKFMAGKVHKNEWVEENPSILDFCIRLLGFLLIGGLFWETAELFGAPLVGKTSDPFFVFPITLGNIDGALDVAVGVVGAAVAYAISQGAKSKTLIFAKTPNESAGH